MAGDDLSGTEDAEGAQARSGAPAAGELAAAFALEQARDDPKVRAKAAAFLDRQAKLSKLQHDMLADERPLRLGNFHTDNREGELRRLGLWLRNLFQLFVAVVAGLVGIGAIILVHDAATSQRVVMEPFNTPPALAASGLNGRTVAGGLLDALTRLQAATHASAAKRNLKNAWTGDIKIEVPETGVSIGELDRLLHERFGHDIHIDGDLVQARDGGLTLSVRGDGVMPRTFHDPAGDLDKLTTQAAEYIYGESEPYLFAVYLSNDGRDAEAVSFVQARYAASAPVDKPFLLNVWGNALSNQGHTPEALARYREAVRLKPDYWIPYNNVMNSLWVLGDEEGVWRTGQEMIGKAGGRPGKATEVYYQNLDTIVWNLPALRAELEADMRASGGFGTSNTSVGPGLADVAARQHDPAQADLYLATSTRSVVAPDLEALTHFVRGYMALERGDGPQAGAEMEAFAKAYANPVISTNYPGYGCWIAPAEELAGHPDKADAALKAGGRYVDCYRFRGDILDHRGDWAGAWKAYGEAIALAPDLPAAYYSRGRALTRHGALRSAMANYALAAARGPGWADPLKAWGDALAAQGQWKPALKKYDAALRLAPAWSELKQARAAAAAKA